MYGSNTISLFLKGVYLHLSGCTRLILSLNIYYPECPPGGRIVYPGGQQKKFLPFGHVRNVVAFKGTVL